MEVALLNKSALSLKGKHTSFIVNPQDATSANAALVLNDTIQEVKTDESVILQGAGEYEIGGVKIIGIKQGDSVLYSLSLDGIEIVVGKIQTLSAMQHKLKEHNIVITLCTETTNASFLTSLAVNTLILYGEKAEEIIQGFEKEDVKKMNKYTVAAGKLPTEVETILFV